jgi:hypothetical protein
MPPQTSTTKTDIGEIPHLPLDTEINPSAEYGVGVGLQAEPS